jgi:hypothetical protein
LQYGATSWQLNFVINQLDNMILA